MFLYSMRPYVIVVGCVRVPGVPVLVKSGHREKKKKGRKPYYPVRPILSQRNGILGLHTSVPEMRASKVSYRDILTP